MISNSIGKKIVVLGFGLNLLTTLANTIFAFGIGGYFLPYTVSYFTYLNIINIVSLLASLIAAGGFGIMWLSSREMLDLAPAAVLGLDVAVYLLSMVLDFNGIIVNLLYSVFIIALYGLLALRVRDKNRMLFLLMGCAIAFRLLLIAATLFIPGLYIGFLGILVQLGYIACAGVCLIVAMQE